jgi:hypothetical protein
MSLWRHDDAEADIQRAAAWYQQHGRDDEFLEAVALARIQLLPRASGYARPPVAGREVRRHNIRGFDYSVIYEVVGDDQFVLAVPHHRQQPGSWHARLP